MPAIYTQESKSLQQEWLLVDLCTKREKYCADLSNITNQLKENRRQADDQTMIISMELILLVRKTTFELLAAIRGWQKGFTRLRRPQLMEKDYMVEMVSDIDFANTTPLRKKFNFMLGRGNLFLLPIQATGRDVEPVECSPRLAELIHKFANPSDDDLQFGYQALINSLPPPDYARVVQAEKWVLNPWKPDIVIVEPKVKDAMEEEMERVAAKLASTTIKEGDVPDAKDESEKERAAQAEDGKEKDIKDEKDEKKKKKKEPKLTKEQLQDKAADEAAAALEAEMSATRTRRREKPPPEAKTVIEKASRMSFNTSMLRGINETATQRKIKEDAEKAEAARKRMWS